MVQIITNRGIYLLDEKIPTLKKAHECISKANKISDLSKLESQMLKALEQRYPKNPDIDDFQPFSDVAIGMKKVFEIYPNDLDIICFYVESLMNRTPWKLWDFRKVYQILKVLPMKLWKY